MSRRDRAATLSSERAWQNRPKDSRDSQRKNEQSAFPAKKGKEKRPRGKVAKDEMSATPNSTTTSRLGAAWHSFIVRLYIHSIRNTYLQSDSPLIKSGAEARP